MRNPINVSYEFLTEAGLVGVDRGRFSESTARWAGRQCDRGGCHRLADATVTSRWTGARWIVCRPCYDAITKET